MIRRYHEIAPTSHRTVSTGLQGPVSTARNSPRAPGLNTLPAPLHADAQSHPALLDLAGVPARLAGAVAAAGRTRSDVALRHKPASRRSAFLDAVGGALDGPPTAAAIAQPASGPTFTFPVPTETTEGQLNVDFVGPTEPVPVDRSQLFPGPPSRDPTKIADRAGYTSGTYRTTKPDPTWGTAPAGDGTVVLFMRQLDIGVALVGLKIAISSRYAEDSRPYRLTLEHEKTHVDAFTRIFQEAQQPFRQRLQSAVLTRQSGIRAAPSQLEAVKQRWLDRITAPILADARKDLLAGPADSDRREKDRADAYAEVYRQATPDEWAGTPAATGGTSGGTTGQPRSQP